MEIDFAPSLNPSLFGSLSISPPASMFDTFSPLGNFNDDFLDSLNPSTDDDDVDDWLKPLSFDQLFDDDLQLNLNDLDVKQEENKQTSTLSEDKYLINNFSQNTITNENDFVDLYLPQTTEQQLPSTTTTTTTVRLIHQAKFEPNELPTTLFVNGNEFQFHPILTNNSNNQTLTHSYTTTASSLPIQSSIPIVPARVLKGKKFKRGGRVNGRGTSRTGAATKRRLNSSAAEPKASVVIIAEDATRIDSKTTTLGLSSNSSHDCELLKSSSNVSSRSSTRRRIKATPREVILFRNGTFVSKEPISKQPQTTTTTTTVCFETNNGTTSTNVSPLHSQQITATGLQAAAQIVACNVLRQATLNDALIEQLIKREPNHSEDDYPIYCYSTPSGSSTSVTSSSSSACSITAAIDEYETNCSTTLKILGCNTAAPLTPTTSTTTTTIELLTLAALQQQQQQQQQQQKTASTSQICYIKQEPLTTTTTTTTTFLLPRLLP